MQGTAGYTWVGSDLELAAAARSWRGVPAVALDTEFVRTRTFFPRLGLIQIATSDTCLLIDPLALSDVAPLVALLEEAATLKVIHSASEDVEVLFRAFGVTPAPLLDTQIAGALCGIGPALSYQRMVGELLGVELAKNETRTDWLARPLSPAQRQYAAEDVAYLVNLAARLREELDRRGRFAWALEDSAGLLDTGRFDGDPAQAYFRIRGAGNLDPRQLAICRGLAAWREGEARRRDLPRGFVLRDELLVQLATRRPTTSEEIVPLVSGDLSLAKRDGAAWLEQIRAALDLPESELPPRLWRLPSSTAVRALERKLRERVRLVAQTLDLAPESLAPRRLLDATLRGALERRSGQPVELPADLDGWRRSVIGEVLLEEIRAAGL